MAVPINQLAIYALILVLGWLLGLLSRSGGGVWRRKYEAERDARIALEKAHDDRDAAARTRIAELERHAPAVGAGTAGSIAAAAAGRRDDLSLIRGVGRAGETRLNEAGIHRFVDLSRLSDADAAALEGRLGAAPGTIAREEWREQAALLASGQPTSIAAASPEIFALKIRAAVAHVTAAVQSAPHNASIQGDERCTCPAPTASAATTRFPPPAHLSALEQRVVLLAKRDADRGAIVPRQSGFARLMTLLTGIEGPQPLADDRLETLRRFACFERRGDRRAAQVAADLLGLGFSAEALAGASAIARA